MESGNKGAKSSGQTEKTKMVDINPNMSIFTSLLAKIHQLRGSSPKWIKKHSAVTCCLYSVQI